MAFLEMIGCLAIDTGSCAVFFYRHLFTQIFLEKVPMERSVQFELKCTQNRLNSEAHSRFLQLFSCLPLRKRRRKRKRQIVWIFPVSLRNERF